MNRLSSRPHSHSRRSGDVLHSSRRSWAAAGAIAATAALVGAVDLHAAPEANHSLTAILARTEKTLSAWDSPEHILAETFRVRLVPAQHGARHALEALPAQGAQNPPQFRFAIAPGPLAAALAEFQRITGVTVRVASDLTRGLTTDGVTGTLTAEAGLAQLLEGSSLSHRFASANVAEIDIRLGEQVDVSGAVPAVASTKYSAPLVEVPQTIQVIPQALIEEQGATTLSEALRNVPGITMQAGEGGGAASTTGDMFNMRGFTASNSLFVDGVRDDGLLARDVYNLEQIEVFSGPTGSDVGRTNAAGYVNMTTKQPGVQAARSLSLTYGSNDHVRGTFDFNQPLTIGDPDSWLGQSAVRVNVLLQDGGVAGRDHVDREAKSIAPSIAFGLTTPTRLVISGQVMRQDNVPDYGLPQAASPIGPLTATGVVAENPVDQTNFYGNPDVDFDRAEQDNVTVRLEHDFNANLTLRNQTRYNSATREAVVSAITGALNLETNTINASRQGNFRTNEIVSNQTNLVARVATGAIEHALNLGLEVSSEDYNQPTFGGFGSPRALDVYNPDVFTPVVGMDVQPTGGTAEGSTATVAFYIFDGIDVTSRVRLDGGVRVERYDTKTHAINANTGAVTDLDGEGTLFSGKLGAVFQLNESGNVYVSYGTSLTPPGSSNFQLSASETNQNNPNIDPQQSTNIEVGSKWAIADGRFQLSGSVFRTENTNVIFVVDDDVIPPIFNQDDGQLVRGVSLAGVGRLMSAWDLSFSLQYLDTEVRSQGPNNGRFLTLTPKVAGSFWTTVTLPGRVRVGGGYRYTDSVFVNTANTLRVPSYGVADALVEVPIGQALALRLNVNNLTNKVYIRSINSNGGRYNPGTPRSFLLTTAFRF